MEGSLDDGARRWDERYGGAEWFFGKEPSILGRLMVAMWKQAHGDRAAAVIDLGCGEGRDSVFFAQQGWTVDAVDQAAVGVEKAKRLAADSRVELRRVECLDLRDAELTGHDVLFAHNSVSGLAEECLPMLARIRGATPVGGMNAIRVFTNVSPRESDRRMYLFGPNELFRAYEGWRVFYYGEDLLWHPQSGQHRSFADVVAQKL